MKVSVPRQPGRQELIGRGAGGAKELSLARINLGQGQREAVSFADEEAVIVLLGGAVTFAWPGASHDAERADPFAKPASAVYLPPGATVEISAKGPAELIVVAAPTVGGGQPVFTGPDEVEVNPRGRNGYTREVHDILVGDAHANRLLVGETFNPPANWSSFPPHKHDGEDGEPYLEEVYYYRTNPGQGFGFQGLYTQDESVDRAYLVRDGDAVLISRGYHPVAAAPGYTLYYLWALAGGERRLTLFEDPHHRWLHGDQGR